MRKKIRNWDLFLKNRGELFGISTILIVALHYFQDVLSMKKTGLIPAVAEIYNSYVIKSLGVEIFMLLSGIGIACSLMKDSDVGGFYGRRFRRVVLPYLVWGSLYWAVYDMVGKKLGIAAFLKDFFFVSMFTEGVTRLWFIILILVLYFLSPFLYDVLFYDGKHRFLKLVLLLLIVMVPTVVLAWKSPVFYKHVEIALTRIPACIFGLYIGKRAGQHEEMKHPWLILLGLVPHTLLVILKLTGTGGLVPAEFLTNKWPFMRFAMILYGFSLMFLLELLLEKIRLPRFKQLLALAGSYSLEIYMTHVCVRSILRDILKLSTGRVRYYSLIIVISVIASILLKRTVEGILLNRENGGTA